MPDPRVQQYARLIVERCIGVQPGWQVSIQSSPLARPLIEEVYRALARVGAYALTRIGFDSNIWASEAPEELVRQWPSVTQFEMANIDALIAIGAPENTAEGAEIPASRRALQAQAAQPMNQRLTASDFPWVICQYPTPALAQNAGMSLAHFEDFLYGACLLDWDEEARKMRHLADHFDRADTVRIEANGTDLTISLAGRHGMIDDGHKNMPGGEFFYSPVEDATEGVITFSEFPAVYGGQEVAGARMVYHEGKVVEASAQSGQEFLRVVLQADAGSSTLGELGIGCNPGITRFMKNTLYDEKINGTVHLAIGQGFPFIGGQNKSNIHWDMVKDLRQGGRLYCDGELVQENGNWLI